jgi:hypothetical protein
VLLGTIEEIELGQFLPTLFNKINAMTDTMGQAEQALKESTSAIESVNSNLGSVTAGLLDRPTFNQAQVLIDDAILGIDLSNKVEMTLFSNTVNSIQGKLDLVDKDIVVKTRRLRMGVTI